MRQFRELDDETKRKISASTIGKSKSYDHRLHISQGMKKYWQGVPYKDGAQNKGQNQSGDAS